MKIKKFHQFETIRKTEELEYYSINKSDPFRLILEPLTLSSQTEHRLYFDTPTKNKISKENYKINSLKDISSLYYIFNSKDKALEGYKTLYNNIKEVLDERIANEKRYIAALLNTKDKVIINLIEHAKTKLRRLKNNLFSLKETKDETFKKYDN